ncbi:MAG: tetratricopeptide repeat protein [Bacteroides sp.]|nr:tetratricopeptide repeat protein [Bacteroides sp.]MDD2645678.1 tetratricopeptide repeat protein [Bacteroides sp.]MDD4055979.1 tetratricopeptide repeat protein [Bacteroides sp.]NLI64732.1 tetratricopeptide repeat protein [Bacteroidales bacterium]
MTKKLYLPLLMVFVLIISSCSSKMGELPSDYFTTTPQVLEAVGGKVPVTINGRFPEKYFKKKAVVEVTPVLKWKGGEARGNSVTFQGEKVHGNHQTMSYKMGGNYTMKTSFDYQPEMARSELFLEFTGKIGNKRVSIPPVKVAEGVIATSALIEKTLSNANPANGDDAFQRIIKEAHKENIMFLIHQANIRTGEMQKIKGFKDEASTISEAANKKVNNVEVSAYASPDGPLSLNTRLASNRESNAATALSRELKRADVDALVDTKYTAEDWDGFKELVSQSNIQDKELILRVLEMYSDPQQREQEIKNISSVYSVLADEILPQLRRARLTLNYEIIGKSDAEISNLAATNPSELNVEELLYAATLTENVDTQKAIYTQATKQFPNDYRGFNNLGRLAYEAGDFSKAESFFKEAARVESTPQVNMNLGLIALTKGDLATAESHLGKASGSKELNETMGNLYVAQGQYDRAVNSFGDAKTNSAALAQILAQDYNKAKNTLENVSKPDAYTDYLLAVVGARTNNLNMVTGNLAKAVAKNPALAKKAATDLEFSRYFTSSEFMNIIK